jgi:hypothetical protein
MLCRSSGLLVEEDREMIAVFSPLVVYLLQKEICLPIFSRTLSSELLLEYTATSPKPDLVDTALMVMFLSHCTVR